MIEIGRYGEYVISFAFGKAENSRGCLMAMISGNLEKDLIDFSNQNISQDNLVDDGVEKEPHISLIFGWNPDFETQPLEAFLENQESLSFTLGSVSRFQCPDYDVLKVEASCPEAQTLHYNLKNNFRDSIATTYPTYVPHATLGYVKKDAHPELDGHQAFAGKKFSVSSLLYSPPDRTGRKYLKLRK